MVVLEVKVVVVVVVVVEVLEVAVNAIVFVVVCIIVFKATVQDCIQRPKPVECQEDRP